MMQMAPSLPQTKIPAVFMRGGTSKGLFFHARHLPDDDAGRNAIFCAALGSPDPYGRQLDGMGGGISSLSKVMVVGPPSRADADLDYTFGQVAVGEAAVDYRSNCGNLSSAVGPFALDEGLVEATGERAEIRLHNTNTGKIVISRFAISAGKAAVAGTMEIAGVAGSGARVRLDFVQPGGAVTGRLLPTGNVLDTLTPPGLDELEASLVDATNPVVFVSAAALGLAGDERPEELERDAALLERMESVRGAAAVRMGLASTPREAARTSLSSPKLALVTAPRPVRLASGERLEADAMDVNVRMISMGRPHRAVPLTGALCLAVAARIEGTLVHRLTRPAEGESGDIRIAHPAGVVPLAASVTHEAGQWSARQVTAYRTARRLMEGSVLVPHLP